MSSSVLAAKDWKTNADLIVDVVRLGYLHRDWITLDPTFGKGIWWQRWRPRVLFAHDRSKDGSDFRCLPYEDGEFDAIAYDPPYVCVSDDTEILTQRGWQTLDTLQSDDLVYTLRHGEGVGEWQPIEEIMVFSPMERTMLSLEGHAHSSLTTLDHRWPVWSRQRADGVRIAVPTWATSGSLKHDDRIPLTAPAIDLPLVPKYSDALVELVAWFWTEGTLERQRDGRLGSYGNIVQSHVVNNINCQQIRATFTREFGPPSQRFPRVGRNTDGIPRWRETIDGHKKVFWFSSDLGRILLELAPDKVPSCDFILSLTPSQLRLFVDVSLRADGYTNKYTALAQKRREGAEAFQFACILLGHSTSLHPSTNGWNCRVRSHTMFKPSRNRPMLIKHNGPVWCVRTQNSTWLARRNGHVYFTGNCVGGRKTTTMPDFQKRYGMDDAPSTPAKLQQLINDGLTEMHRLSRPRMRGRRGGIVLVKCQDYVSSGKLWIGTHHTLAHALSLGFECLDRLEHIGDPRPQPKRTRADGTPSVQQHARRNLSTLFVLRKT